MSFALTTEQIRNRTKTVTRRTGWQNLKPGSEISAVVKGMGLKKGEKIQRLCTIRIVDVRQERLSCLTGDEVYGKHECAREGFPEMVPEEFVKFFCGSHKGTWKESLVTRIEFEYV